MDYKIIRATPETGQIEVEYIHDGKVAGVYAIDVPVVDGAYITGDVLDAEIRLRAPSWAVQREQEVASATGFDKIVALVTAPVTQEVSPDDLANSLMWQQQQFEKQVAEVLVKFGVLQVNPTEIQVSVL